MAPKIAQVCLFKKDGTDFKRLLALMSKDVEAADEELTSFRFGGAAVAHHQPAGAFDDDHVVVTFEVDSPAEVDNLYTALKAAGMKLPFAPEDTDWGYRNFYVEAAPKLVFEVAAVLR